MNSVNGGRKDEGGRKKSETRKVRGQNSAPTLKLNKLLSQLSQTPKKIIFSFSSYSLFFPIPKNKKKIKKNQEIKKSNFQKRKERMKFFGINF